MAASEDELQSALSLIECERVKQTGSREMTVDEIVGMGGVEYVTKHVTDNMRKQAHDLSMPNNKCVKNRLTTEKSSPLEQAYKVLWLNFFQVQKYLDEVNLHLANIQSIGKILYPSHEQLLQRFSVHDCSKFTYKEVYGYVLRWTHGIKDCPEWKESLENHLQTNDHHPEFFRGEPMNELGLLESVVDMLSWRSIKNRAQYPGMPLQDWLFDVEDRYLERYLEEDRLKVRQLLTEWKSTGFDLSSVISQQ